MGLQVLRATCETCATIVEAELVRSFRMHGLAKRRHISVQMKFYEANVLPEHREKYMQKVLWAHGASLRM